MSSRRIVVLAFSTLVALVASLVSSGARADGFDAQRFVPAAGAAGGFVVERPIVPRHLGWGLGAFVAYGHRPVVVNDRARDTVLAAPLENAMSVDAVGSIGLWNFLELAAHVPIRPIWQGDDVTASGQALRARAGLGDVRFVPKVRFFDVGSESFHASLGAAVPVSLPTGSSSALRGAGAVMAEPRLLFGLGGVRWDLIFSGGYAVRPGADTNLAGKREITFGSAFTYAVSQGKVPVDLQVEVYGAHLPDAQTLGSKTPVEGLVGAIVWPSDHVSLYFGAGPGISKGLGAPDFRAVFGIRYGDRVPGRDRYRDRDGDGIDNEHDRCPDRAEDKDGFQDHDGCPEDDNDQDGIPDDDDECPDQPEEVGGDGDGCPDKAKVIVHEGRIEIVGKVQFETGSAKIMKKSEPLLDEVARAMKAHPEVKRVRIEGHTDSTGPIEVNDDLSQKRAEAVEKALVKRGIAEKRLETKGYGPRRPMAPNETRAGRARNRRVEFVIVK